MPPEFGTTRVTDALYNDVAQQDYSKSIQNRTEQDIEETKQSRKI